ncbi:ribonuclease p 40kda subunit [Trichoderma arundinaceum]|uniref:Ribonuclease p 40kda subunit n=1 Tax=Trichoderma arundinaceum TaxID=490622 RepID=A0A395NDX8_TRIAR|nr:ribonuclease p 40kda subunit [Trichoderma arundinaceum]
MLHQAPSIYQSPKCFVTYGTMGHVDLIIPQDIYELVVQKLAERDSPAYYRAVMTLGQVLEKPFLTQFIKLGNIMMLSEGKTTMGNLFTLREGNLDLYLDRETYERAGLEGKPYGIKGDRGSKPRWKVSYNLREESMLHGRKRFDRLAYACKNVLNQPMTWLVCDASSSSMSLDLLESLSATKKTTSSPRLAADTGIPQIPLRIPSTILAQGDREALEYSATELYEWLSLVRLESPRVVAEDTIDPYLSRYSPPEADGTVAQTQVCKLSWQGFLPPSWLRSLFVDVVTNCPSQSWFALSGTTFSRNILGGCNELSFLRPPESSGEFLMWETKSLD